MALYKYFKPISQLCKKYDELELPDPKDPKIPIASNVVDEINKTAKNMFILLTMVLHLEALTER